jgi:hypothetical protein
MKTNWLIWILCLPLIVFSNCSKNPEPEIKCIANISPADSALVPENSVINLSWKKSPGAFMYDVYLNAGDDAPTRIASNLSTTSYNYSIPSGSDINYSWYVQSKNTKGDSIGCSAGKTSFIAKSLPALDVDQKIVNVLVLNFDPDIVGKVVTRKTHEYFSWNDPRELADGYINDVLTASNNLIKYNIVEWRDLNEFPMKKDGFVYTSSTYMSCIKNSTTKCHDADGADYARIISDQNVVEGINQKIFEEVWMFGAPYFGFWESCMAGPKAFYINGDVQSIMAKRAFVIMGFSYERGVPEMIHDLCHRTEATMSRVYGSWEADKLTTSWARFAANYTQTHGALAAVGSCHYPPNASVDYDYANGNFVMSTADDWFNYPLIAGNKKNINAETWGGMDYQHNYLKWWFNHLPRRVGQGPDGKLNCWWRYIFEYNETILHNK